MRIALCDDEDIFNVKLTEFIKRKYNSLDLRIESFTSGESLAAHYRNGKPHFDLIFLDIEMKGMDGFRTARLIGQLAPGTIIIFLTSHEEMACTGYEVSAFRFLTKPVNGTKVVEAIEAAKAEQLQKKSVLIQNAEGEYRVWLDELFYIEAQNQQVLFKGRDGVTCFLVCVFYHA